MITHTEAGKAIITHHNLTTLTSPKWGTNGSIALGILLKDDNTPECWGLFWQWGGDWCVFEDGAERDAQQLNGWEPAAIREAIRAAVESCPDCEGDLEWFDDWAAAAEETLANA